MTKAQRLTTVINRFKAICLQTGTPLPSIIRASLKTDPCDVTDAEANNGKGEIRFNIKAADKNIDPIYHAAHVFGHWLCDLHAAGNTNEHDPHDPRCDMAADVIANFIMGQPIKKFRNFFKEEDNADHT